MAITTTLQKRYVLQKIFVILVCLVMGLWGLYDYVYKIPAQQRAYERGQVAVQVKEALEAEPGAESRPLVAAALTTVRSELDALVKEGMKPQQDSSIAIDEVVSSIRARNEEQWLAVLMIFGTGLGEAQGRAPGSTPSPTFVAAHDVSKQIVNATAEITPPSRFDRATQWMFILCLPFAPYFLWSLLRARRITYRLEDDGSLVGPDGTWSADEIADVDMSNWMRKSIATVVHTDGRRLKLDDYVHADMHLIVGALATRFHPDDWTEEAKKRTADDGDGPADAEPNDAAPEPEREPATADER